MPNYAPQITAYNNEINTNITVKSAVNSIDPVDVGEGFTDLANLLLPIINQINEFNILGGSTAPTSGMGVLNDVYFEFGPSLKIYKKSATDWVLKVNGDLGINIVDGNISVQLTIMGSTVTSSSGNWGIDNTIYGKTLPDEYTVPTADLNLDRIDGLFGNKSNGVVYEQGTASSSPSNPDTPTDTVSIGYVYVPSQASGNGAYIIGGVPPIIATLQSVLDSGRVGDRMHITQSLEIPLVVPTVVNAGNIWVGAGTSSGGGGGGGSDITLTTIGTSGPATLIDDVLNIPNYTSASGSKAIVGSTTFSVSSGAGSWPVTIGETQDDSNYKIFLTIRSTSTAVVPTIRAVSGKSTTQFYIDWTATGNASIVMEWLLLPSDWTGGSGGGGGGYTLPIATNSVLGGVKVGSGLSIDPSTGVLSNTGGGGGGGVSSVAISSTDFNVSGSPITTSGTITLNTKNGAITFAKMQNIAPKRLVGNSTSGSTTMESISIGSGLLLEDGTLSATGGGGGGGVSSVSAGNGMSFTTITGSGAVTMGTPSEISATSTNSVGSGTHTHAIDLNSIDQLNLSKRLRIPTTKPTGPGITIQPGDIWIGEGTSGGS